MDILNEPLANSLQAFRVGQGIGALCGDATGNSFHHSGWSYLEHAFKNVGRICSNLLIQARRRTARPDAPIWKIAVVLLVSITPPVLAAEDPTAIAFQIRDELDETSRDLLRAMNIYLEIQSRVPNEELVNSVYD
ncbi:MAG: hypothetical protein ABI771_14770, partial [Betaproteobacteria bacterium]